MTAHEVERDFLAATTRALQDQPPLFPSSRNERCNSGMLRSSSGLRPVLKSRKRIPRVFLNIPGGGNAARSIRQLLKAEDTPDPDEESSKHASSLMPFPHPLGRTNVANPCSQYGLRITAAVGRKLTCYVSSNQNARVFRSSVCAISARLVPAPIGISEHFNAMGGRPVSR
jgi:hypothetical protein